MVGIPSDATAAINKNFNKEAFIFGFCVIPSVQPNEMINTARFYIICKRGRFPDQGPEDAEEGWFFVQLNDVWNMRWDDATKKFIEGNINAMPDAGLQTDFELLTNVLRWKVTHREQGEEGEFYRTSVYPIMHGNTSGLDIPTGNKASNWGSTEVRLAKYGRRTAESDFGYIGLESVRKWFTADAKIRAEQRKQRKAEILAQVEEQNKIKQAAAAAKKKAITAGDTKADQVVQRKSSNTPAKASGSGHRHSSSSHKAAGSSSSKAGHKAAGSSSSSSKPKRS